MAPTYKGQVISSSWNQNNKFIELKIRLFDSKNKETINQLKKQIFGYNYFVILKIERQNSKPGVILGFKFNSDNLEPDNLIIFNIAYQKPFKDIIYVKLLTDFTSQKRELVSLYSLIKNHQNPLLKQIVTSKSNLPTVSLNDLGATSILNTEGLNIE